MLCCAVLCRWLSCLGGCCAKTKRYSTSISGGCLCLPIQVRCNYLPLLLFVKVVCGGRHPSPPGSPSGKKKWRMKPTTTNITCYILCSSYVRYYITHPALWIVVLLLLVFGTFSSLESNTPYHVVHGLGGGGGENKKNDPSFLRMLVRESCKVHSRACQSQSTALFYIPAR